MTAGGADQDRYLSRGQAAAYLGVPVLTVYEWAKKGRLRHRLTLGGHLRFRVADLDGVLAGDAAGSEASKSDDETNLSGDGMPEAPREPGQGPDDYLTAGETARRLYVSPKTVNRWANLGRIRCIVTIGGHRRYRREDVEAAVRAMSGRGAGQGGEV